MGRRPLNLHLNLVVALVLHRLLLLLLLFAIRRAVVAGGRTGGCQGYYRHLLPRGRPVLLALNSSIWAHLSFVRSLINGNVKSPTRQRNATGATSTRRQQHSTSGQGYPSLFSNLSDAWGLAPTLPNALSTPKPSARKKKKDNTKRAFCLEPLAGASRYEGGHEGKWERDKPTTRHDTPPPVAGVDEGPPPSSSRRRRRRPRRGRFDGDPSRQAAEPLPGAPAGAAVVAAGAPDRAAHEALPAHEPEAMGQVSEIDLWRPPFYTTSS